MEDNDVDEVEWVGVSVGEAAAVEGSEYAVVDVTVLCRRDLSGLAVVEAMLNEVDNRRSTKTDRYFKSGSRLIQVLVCPVKGL